MPRFFFNIRNHVNTEDFVGDDLTDLKTAKLEAQKDIVDIKKAKPELAGNHWPKWSIEICGVDRKVLLIVPFSSN